MKKYEKSVESMMFIGEYNTLRDLAKALKISPQTISSHKKTGRIPDKIALRFCRIHGCKICPEGLFELTDESNVDKKYLKGGIDHSQTDVYNFNQKLQKNEEVEMIKEVVAAHIRTLEAKDELIESLKRENELLRGKH